MSEVEERLIEHQIMGPEGLQPLLVMPGVEPRGTSDEGEIIPNKMWWIRHFYTGKQFFRTEIRPFAPVRANSQCWASITEVRGDNTPFSGIASVEVHNVQPDSRSIWITGRINWDSNLKVQISVLWVNI